MVSAYWTPGRGGPALVLAELVPRYLNSGEWYLTCHLPATTVSAESTAETTCLGSSPIAARRPRPSFRRNANHDTDDETSYILTTPTCRARADATTKRHNNGRSKIKTQNNGKKKSSYPTGERNSPPTTLRHPHESPAPHIPLLLDLAEKWTPRWRTSAACLLRCRRWRTLSP